MERGTSVKLKVGNAYGVVLLSPDNVDGMTMCLVRWNEFQFNWERMEDLECA